MSCRVGEPRALSYSTCVLLQRLEPPVGGPSCSGVLTARTRGNTFRPEERAIVLYNKLMIRVRAPWLCNHFLTDYYNSRKPVFDFSDLPVCFAAGLS